MAKKKKFPVEQEMSSDPSVPTSPSDHEAVDAEQHKHCECVEALSIRLENPEVEVEVLRSRINHLEDRASSLQDGQEHVFSISKIKILPHYFLSTLASLLTQCFKPASTS